MKFSEKFKKNKSEAVETETAQDSGKKKHKPDPKKLVGTISKKHIKNGTYSMAMAAIFIVIVVVINMIVGAIPSKYSQLDVSSSKLYTIGDETKKVLKALDKDVTIYQIAPSGSEDDTISNLLSRYKDESKHIKVEVKDPVVNPKFASEYTSDDLASNSLIVVCGDRNKVINYNDMYSTSVDYNTWQQTTTGFDGEGQITSAIGYVTSENLPIMYTLSGHGEKDLDSSFKEDIQKANIDIKDLNLLTEGKVPDDADCLMIVSPTSDISEEEKTEILDYLEAGGKAMIFSDYTQDDLPNFDAVLENYGVKRAAGIVFEGDSQHYGMQMPYPPMYYMPPQQQAAPEPKTIKTTKPAMPQFEEHATSLNEEQESNLDLLMSVPVDVAVEIGRTRRRVKDILNYTKGSLVVLDRLAGDRADLYVNGKCIAKGDIVVVDDNFGLRIAEIIEPLALEDL